MANARKVVIEFIGQDKNLGKTTDQLAGKTSQLGAKLKKFGAVAAAGFAVAGAAIAKGSVDAIDKASDLNETLSKSDAIFGRNANAMEKWASGAARSAGLSKAAALEAAAGFGDMFNQIGFTGNQAAKMSKSVVQMSADLGSFNNLDTADVADRMSAAFRGEYDSLQAVIPNINAARVESEALAKTGKKTAKELTAQEKAAAVLAIVHKDGARAMGDFDRTSGGLANQQKILRAQLENVQASIGQKLLPVAVELFTWFNDKALPAIESFGGYLSGTLPPIFKKVRAVVAKVMGALKGDVSGNMSGIRQVIKDAASIIQSLWKAFGGTIVQFTKAAFTNLRTIIGGAFKIIRGIFKTVAALLKGDWKGAWDGIKLILRGAVQVIKGVVSQMWNVIRTVFKAAGTAIRGIFSGIWTGIKATARNGAEWLVGAIRAIPGRLTSLGKSFASAGKGLLQSFLNGMKNAAGFISGIAGNVWSAVKGLLNGAIDKINSALEFKIKIPAAPDVTVNPPNIPHLAKGGIVAKPTVALIGEDGPEAVVPLGAKNRPKGAMPGLGGDTYVFNISGVIGDQDQLAKTIEQMMARRSRLKGPLQFRTI